MLKIARNRYVLFQILAKRGKRSPTPEKSCSRSHIPKNRENRELFNPTGRKCEQAFIDRMLLDKRCIKLGSNFTKQT